MFFSALFVCTGNICRSPAAELLFRARVAPLPIRAASAGTSGLSGYGMDAVSARALRRFGVDPSDHAARRLTTAMLDEADVILTADSEHRAIMVRSEPAVFRRAFTMREFARLGADLPPLSGEVTRAALQQRVSLIAAQRGAVGAGAPGSDDIGDPFGAGFDIALATVHAVSAATDGIIHALGIRPGLGPSATRPDGG